MTDKILKMVGYTLFLMTVCVALMTVCVALHEMHVVFGISCAVIKIGQCCVAIGILALLAEMVSLVVFDKD